jgi:hypothetical protein
VEFVERFVAHEMAPLLLAEPPVAVVDQNHVSVTATARAAATARCWRRSRGSRSGGTDRGEHRQPTLGLGTARARSWQRCFAHGPAQFESGITRRAAIFVDGHVGSVDRLGSHILRRA